MEDGGQGGISSGNEEEGGTIAPCFRIAMPLLFAPMVLASSVGVSVSFSVPTVASLSVITSLGPMDDGNMVDKEGAAAVPCDERVR